MSQKTPNNNILEDVDSSEQPIRIEKDIPIDKESSGITNNDVEKNEEYKERIIVNHSDSSVGVKKIIIGEETTSLPEYQKPKKDIQTTLRDVSIYLMMIAIVSILVILLLKYCNKEDKATLLDISTTTTTTTKLTSTKPNTETTETTTTLPSNTETTTALTTKKNNLVMPTTPKAPKPTTPTTPPPVTPSTSPTKKPEETPTEPIEDQTPSDSPDNSEEQE